jgi:DNA-binding winged helix-turn-helix (wHTH) protein
MDKIFNQKHDVFIIGQCVGFDTGHDRLFTFVGFGPTVRLTSMEIRILLQFVRAPQTLLRRETLFNEGWRRYGMDVCEDSLNQIVYSLREAFCTIVPASSYIKTLPHVGYVLNAPVRSGQENSRARQRPTPCGITA